MADWFAHRLDAEEIARDRMRRTGKLHFIRMAHKRGGFLVISTQKTVPKKPISEINLADPTPVTERTYIGTTDCTPTWSAILPALLLILEESETAEGQIYARDELKRMAALADRFVELQKKDKAA